MALEIDPDSSVGNDEWVYRRVVPGKWEVVEGELKISRSAFDDRAMRPSVDRALLRAAEVALEREENGLAELRAGDVRALKPTPELDKRGEETGVEHRADIVPDPIQPENPAHALITPMPLIEKKNLFRRFCESIARTAAWKILPPEHRSNTAG